MDGKNCTGRKISLLNDSSDVGPLFAAKAQHHTLPPLTGHHHTHPSLPRFTTLESHSRASSCSSSPSLSPQTPHLVRSSSSDSRSYATPSPLTPSSNHSFHDHFGHHHAQQQQHAQHPQQYYIYSQRSGKMDDLNGGLYPVPDASIGMPAAYPMPAQIPAQMQVMQPQPAQQLYRTSTSPSSEPSRVSTVSASSANNRGAAPKKNQYPCPLAKQFNCNDYFTTSGHAARHAKKHTGKKDAFCPECNKAFTRKDNMEQHRRTHQTGRGAPRTNGVEDAKVKKPTKPATKKPNVKSEEALEAAVEQQLSEQEQVSQTVAPPAQMQTAPGNQQPMATDPALLIPPVGGPYYLGGVDSGPIPPLPMPTMAEGAMRPPLVRSNFTNSLDYFPPPAQMMGDPDTLNFSYPSPGLSNGLNSLALAAVEHRRLSEEKTKSPSSDDVSP